MFLSVQVLGECFVVSPSKKSEPRLRTGDSTCKNHTFHAGVLRDHGLDFEEGRFEFSKRIRSLLPPVTRISMELDRNLSGKYFALPR